MDSSQRQARLRIPGAGMSPSMRVAAHFRHLEAFYWAGITPGAPESPLLLPRIVSRFCVHKIYVLCAPARQKAVPSLKCLPHSLCRFIGPGLLPITEEVKHVIHSTHAGLYALAGLSTELASLKASQPATTTVHRVGGKCLPSSAALLGLMWLAHTAHEAFDCCLLMYNFHGGHADRLLVACRQPGCSAAPGCTCSRCCSRLIARFCGRDP